MADFDLDVAAKAQPLIEYLDQPDLNLIRHTGFDTTKLAGRCDDEGQARLPDDQERCRKERIEVNVAAKLVERRPEGCAARHRHHRKARSTSPWRRACSPPRARPRSPASPPSSPGSAAPRPTSCSRPSSRPRSTASSARSSASTSAPSRAGPSRVTATIANLADPQGRVDIAADLSEVEMRIQPIGWFAPGHRQDHGNAHLLLQGREGPARRGPRDQGRGPVDQGQPAARPQAPGPALGHLHRDEALGREPLRRHREGPTT